jgi:hypothetical protein
MFIRCIAYWAYPAPADRSFVNNVFVNAGLSALGGGFYVLFLRRPVIEFVRGGSALVLAPLKGGFWGIVATFAASQGIFLAAAFVLTYKMKTAVPEGSLVMAFQLAVMEIETYGLLLMFYILIPAFICGALVTAVVGYLFFPRNKPQA